MKSAVCAMLLFAAANCAASTAAMTLRPVASGAYASTSTDRHLAVIVYTEESYREQWRKLVSESEPAPAVDFTKEIAVLLLAGQKRTGGYAIEPKGVSVDDEGTLVVDAPLRTPGENSYVLQSFTSPWAVIAVEPRRENLSGVRWNP